MKRDTETLPAPRLQNPDLADENSDFIPIQLKIKIQHLHF